MKMNEVVNLNNQELQMDRKARRFHYSMNEIENLMRNKKIVRPVGFIVRTHGYTFEWNHIGWILRPHGYLSNVEVMERFPTSEERMHYYRLMNTQKRKPVSK